MKMNGTSLLKCLAALCMLCKVTASTVIIDFNSDASSCGGGGFMPGSYKVTLSPLHSSKRRASLDSEDKHMLISIIDTWFQQYSPVEATSNGTTRRKLEASTHVVHYLIRSQFAVVIKAGNNVRQPRPARLHTPMSSFLRGTSLLTHGPTRVRTHQTIALMAKDPAVSSIERDCLQRAGMSLPESDSSSPGESHEMEAVARRLSVHVGAPWGTDRIDGDAGCQELAPATHHHRSLALASRTARPPSHEQRASVQPIFLSSFPASHPRRSLPAHRRPDRRQL